MDLRIRLCPEIMLFLFKTPWTTCARQWTQHYIQVTLPWKQCPSTPWCKDAFIDKFDKNLSETSKLKLHPSTQRFCLLMRCNQFFTNKSTNQLLSMSVFRKPPYLTEDQTTNPEAVISLKSKIFLLALGQEQRSKSRPTKPEVLLLGQRQRQNFRTLMQNRIT